MAKIDVRFNKETGTLEVRNIREANADKLLLETTREVLEGLFDGYLNTFDAKVDVKRISKDLAVIAMQHFFHYEPTDSENV